MGCEGRQSYRAHPLLAGMVLTILLATRVGSASGAVLPELPRVFLDTTYAPPMGLTIRVPAGGDFQAALNSALPGDIIELAAGATYTGPFTLPNKTTGAGWIYIRTSAYSQLPPPGTRVGPSQAGLMPKIVGPGLSFALQADQSSHHYRFVGVEFKPAAGAFVYSLIIVGSDLETNLALLPHDIVFDRCYVHGDPTQGGRRGFELNSTSTAIIDSYVADFKEVGADTQAIGGWNGAGPFKIVNNHLEGAGENVLFGGADPSVQNLVPADIEIRGNHFFKPLSWKGTSWTVKNLFELKNARRVLVTGNVFENVWAQAQTGFAVLFTVRNQQGTAPWSDVSDITFTQNIVRHAGSGVQMHGTDDNTCGLPGGCFSQLTKRILIQNNLFDDINSATWGGSGRLYQMIGVQLGGLQDVTIDHNTAFQNGNVITSAIPSAPMSGFTYTNNISPHNVYGVIGDLTRSGNQTLGTYFPGAIFKQNALAGPWPTAGGVFISDYSNYQPDPPPTGPSLFPASIDAVGFVDLAGGNYRLAASSPYKNISTDVPARDLGADIDALQAATRGAISGSPGDTSPPTVALTAPANGSTVSGGGVTVSATASDNVGVASVQFLLDSGNLGPPVTLAPYEIAWNTTTVSNGSHLLAARASDAAGNTATSASVTVTVTNPPTVTSVSPTNGATGVSTGTAVSATFSASMDPATINTSTFGLRDPSNAAVAATVSYNNTTRIATLTPSATLAASATYAATVTGGATGVKDLAGNAMAANVTWSFTTMAPPTCPCTIWSNTVKPATASAADSQPVEVGVKFRADVNGFITGLRFYKGLKNTGTHVGHLWTSTGNLLASVTFATETRSGWQQANLPTPVAITANTTYVASYHTDVGSYAVDGQYFAASGVDRPPLHALANGVDGPNGVYVYGASAFPTFTFNSSNYWVDVVFKP